MTFTELFAAAFGLIGTLLLATRSRHAGWGFMAFLASNAGWLVFAWTNGHWPLFVQQAGFTLSSLLGLWVWIIGPAFGRAYARFERELEA